MNTKLVMSASGLAMGVTGIVLSFLPHEVVNYFSGSQASALDAVVVQILGALYFAFAMTNWAAKANLIGGIYGRPIAIGNLCHFMMAALALTKAYFASHLAILLVPMIVYGLFAVLFAIILFTHPVKEVNN